MAINVSESIYICETIIYELEKDSFQVDYNIWNW